MRYAQALRGGQPGQLRCRAISNVRRSYTPACRSLHSAALVPQAFVRPLLRHAAWHNGARQTTCSAEAAGADASAVKENDSSG